MFNSFSKSKKVYSEVLARRRLRRARIFGSYAKIIQQHGPGVVRLHNSASNISLRFRRALSKSKAPAAICKRKKTLRTFHIDPFATEPGKNEEFYSRLSSHLVPSKKNTRNNFRPPTNRLLQAYTQPDIKR